MSLLLFKIILLHFIHLVFGWPSSLFAIGVTKSFLASDSSNILLSGQTNVIDIFSMKKHELNDKGFYYFEAINFILL